MTLTREDQADGPMTEMEEMQQILVHEHIHELQHEAMALRAERARDARATPRGTGSGPRGRVGRWLIGVGEAIAGQPADSVAEAGDRMASPV
jgi:hypothetical protein